MPGGGQPIVVGGGIQLTGGAIDEFLVLTSITPPTATTSSRWRRNAANTQLIAETATGREDTTIGIGSTNSGIAAGLARPDVILGRNITISHGASGVGNAGVFIGQGIVSSAGSGTGNVVIVPSNIIQNGGTIINAANVIIGGGVTFQNAQTSSVIIGGNATANNNSNVTMIGQSTTANASGVTVVGQFCSAGNANNVVVGQASSATAARAIIIGQGHGAPNADMIKIGHGGQNAGTAGQILIGNSINPAAVGTNEICLGNEANNFTVGLRLGQNQHTSGVVVPAYTVQWKSALGTNIAAGSVTFIAPKATGNAVAGSFVFQTSPAGASGATLQTAATRLTIDPNGGVTLATPTAAAENLVIAGFGGAGQASIRLNNLTNGAGVAAGTLTNAPAAGDPAFWIPVSIAGTVRFVPAW